MGLLGSGSNNAGKQISAGSGVKDEEQVLDQVLLNEASENNQK
jgi:hypothetical protein